MKDPEESHLGSSDEGAAVEDLPRPVTAWPEARWFGALAISIFGPVMLISGFDAESHEVYYFVGGAALIARFFFWLAGWELSFRFSDIAFAAALWITTLGQSAGWQKLVNQGVVILLLGVALLRLLFLREWKNWMPEWEDALWVSLVMATVVAPSDAHWAIPRFALIFAIVLDFAQRAELHRLRRWQASLPEDDPRRAEVFRIGPGWASEK